MNQDHAMHEASKPAPPAAPPVVVIGGGIAGLTAAAYLARAGVPVTVYEQHRLPGGYVSTFQREGFTFPAGLTSFCSNGIVFPILRELGLENERTWVRTYRQMSWDGVDVPLKTSRQVRDQLSALFPDDAAGLRAYFRLVDEGVAWLRAFEKSGLYLDTKTSKLVPLLLTLPFKAPHLLWQMQAHKHETNLDLHARLLSDPALRSMFDRLGYPVMKAFNTLGMWGAYLDDYWLPLHGMQGLANSLVRFIKQHGGQVVLSTRVERILVQDGAAVGVRLAGGEGIPAADMPAAEVPAASVICASDLYAALTGLIGVPHVPPGLLAKAEQGRPSESVVMLYLGLNAAAARSGALDRFQEGHVIYFSRTGEVIQLVLWSKDDPSLAPPGKHTLCIGSFSPYSQWAPWKEAAGEAAAGAGVPGGYSADPGYRACKQAEIRRLLDLAEEFIPNLRQYIEVVDAATPLTYERYTSNREGSSVGWTWDPVRASGIDFAREMGFLKNCAWAGHWTFRMSGMTTAMITARYAARKALSP
jgi:prolycopene isomerase